MIKNLLNVKILLITLFIIILLSGCHADTFINILKEAALTIDIPSETSDNLILPPMILYEGYEINIIWESSDQKIISNEGIINQTEVANEITLQATLSYQRYIYQTFYTVIIKEKSYDFENNVLKKAADKLIIPSGIMENIILPTIIIDEEEEILIYWTSSNETVLNHHGEINRLKDENISIQLKAVLSYHRQHLEKRFDITVYSTNHILHAMASKITFPNVINDSIELPDEYPFGIFAHWTSSNPNIISNTGLVFEPNELKEVSLTVRLRLDEEELIKVFELKVIPKIIPNYLDHHIIDRSSNYNLERMENVEINNNYLILSSNALTGSYESDIFLTNSLISLVGSWSAITGIDNTVELLVRVRVGDKWSSYLSYGIWGLGRQNKGNTTVSTEGLAKMSTDELIILNNQKANAVQYQVILRRDKLTSTSPKLSLVSLALELKNYDYYVNTEFLPEVVDYEVPMLNQNIVPIIGKSICSPTSTTMLLKYKGYNFTNEDSEYEHRYIAKLVRDYGHNIYGNWVYNTAVIGALGLESYVLRMYSLAELKYHLALIGPVAASVKGDMEGLYTTNGHLIVIRGYKEIDGKTYFICNDPNLKYVYCEYSEETIMKTWRSIVYVIR